MSTRYETALVTGGSTGIGAAVVRLLADGGTKVAICARRKEPLDAMVSELGERLVAIQADVSGPDGAAAVVAQAEEQLGALDLVIANAGMGVIKNGAKLEVRHIVDTLQLNVMGATATIAAALPGMVERGRGHVVGISSIAGTRGLPNSAAYSASKAALQVFLESLRVDLAKTGVKVTDIRPGFVDTPLTKDNRFKMPFLLSAEEAARRIVAAIHKERGVYTFPWPMAVFASALRQMPRWLYEPIARKTLV